MHPAFVLVLFRRFIIIIINIIIVVVIIIIIIVIVVVVVVVVDVVILQTFVQERKKELERKKSRGNDKRWNDLTFEMAEIPYRASDKQIPRLRCEINDKRSPRHNINRSER